MNSLPTSRVEHSRWVQRLRRRYGESRPGLAPGEPTLDALRQCHAHLQTLYPDTGDALRVLRQWWVERLAHLDCDAQAPLSLITQGMTWLAEYTLDVALKEATATVAARHGRPRRSDGQEACLWVIGMGKLGAVELNVSSDIDLVYVYDEDGRTQGDSGDTVSIDNHVFFDKVVKQLFQLIGATTEHGQVFRMDLALRPNGESGPSVVSLAALETYFQVQGREWERLAWLKARVVAPAACIDAVPALREVITPFVFRRYLDYNVIEALRELHRQIRAHAQRQSAGRPEREHDVKLGRGGIREIEFIVQMLQVVRGGQFPELRMRPTLQALPALVEARLMPAATADALAKAYTWLRQVEHRIQYLDDKQTHVMPTEAQDLHWMAQTLGLPDATALWQTLQHHRDTVAQEFDRLLRPSVDERPSSEDPTLGKEGLTGLSDALQERVQSWSTLPRMQALREDARHRLMQLVQRTQQWLSEGQISETAALRWCDWMTPLLRRETYLALLLERPTVHSQLLQLLGAGRWTTQYLMKHPGVIDELANPAMLQERFEPGPFLQGLQTRFQALNAQGGDDEESLLNVLRRAHHAELFLTLARDVSGRLSVEQVADDLSALADAVVQVTAQWVWSRLKQKHQDKPCFGVIGYGKWGGKELGYGSDLDIVFVYRDEHPQAAEIYAAFARKLIQWLTTKTSEGDLYEIDTALRPNGNAGLLVSSIEAFADYQGQRGSNTAWVWEHQAMTRARFCVGDPGLQAAFDAVRQQVLCAPREPQHLAREVIAMRQKLRAAYPVPAGWFDHKHSPGGMLDAEFAVQFLVLAHAAQHPGLQANVGNIALLMHAQEVGLLPQPIGSQAADAYRELRHRQHQARLDAHDGREPLEDWIAPRQAILALWQAALGAEEGETND